MACEIIMQIPWEMDDGQLALASYWIQDDGSYTVDMFTDGDHEEIEEADLLSPAEQAIAWRDYYEHAVSTGEDDLRQFNVRREERALVPWHFVFVPTEDHTGVQVVKYATPKRPVHGKSWQWGSEGLPEYVREYLCLDGPQLQGFVSLGELSASCREDKDVTHITSGVDDLQVSVNIWCVGARDPAEVRADIRMAAETARDAEGAARLVSAAFGEAGG